MSKPFGALQGILVLDLTQMLAGPYCAQLLADHGAEVIKIEPPAGDATRTYSPYHPDDKLRSHGGYFQSVNRNKSSVVLDLKLAEDRAKFMALVAAADVLVENYREGVMEKLGVSYEALAEVNPRLVYASIRGFGDHRTGKSPNSNWPAYDVVAQAMGGLIGITGIDRDTVVKVGPGVGDIMPGLMAAFGIVSAVLHARRTGEGQYVDVSMVDTVLSLCERIVYQYSYANHVSEPDGQHHVMFAPFGLYPASDGQVAIACPGQHQWALLCRLMGVEQYASDARFATDRLRSQNRTELNEIVSAFTSRHTKRELSAVFGGHIPFSAVFDAKDVFEDPHFAARDMLPRVPHPGVEQPLAIAGIPMRLSKTPGQIARGAPTLGEHNEEIFTRFGAGKPVGN